MCYKDEDEKLWQEDPYEYIRMKFSKYTPLITWVSIGCLINNTPYLPAKKKHNI